MAKMASICNPFTPILEDHVRFVCISDTHMQLEKRPHHFIPIGDVLLHSGDFTNLGLPREIDAFNNYMGQLPHKQKVVIAGNHELTMDIDLVCAKRHMLQDHFSISEEVFENYLKCRGVETSRQLLTNCVYLEDSGVDICGIKIYGSPWQPEFCSWAFNLQRGEQLLQKWKLIPDNTNILMTHGPPFGVEDATQPSSAPVSRSSSSSAYVKHSVTKCGRHGDVCYSQQHVGCLDLLSTIQGRVKPTFHVFGHVHEGMMLNHKGKDVDKEICEFCNEINQANGVDCSSINRPKLTLTGAVLLGISGSLVLGIYTVSASFLLPAVRRICLPFVPATKAQVSNVFAALSGRSGSFVDIGSGDGRLVIEAAKLGFKSFGVELNRWLLLYSKYSAWHQGVFKKTKFIRQDLWKTNLAAYDNVVIFGVEEMMAPLAEKLSQEMKASSYVVACRYPLSSWQHSVIIGNGLNTVWLYKVQ